MRRLTLAVLCLAVLVGCQPGVAPLTDEDIAALNNLRATHVEAVLAGDLDAYLAVYAEDAEWWAPNAPAVEGREAIRTALESSSMTVQALTLTSLEIDGYGNLAFDRGTFSQTAMSEGMVEPATITGKYVAVVRKQDDGTWLWTVDMWNTDAPMPQPEQP